jgi:hypothetical protein
MFKQLQLPKHLRLILLRIQINRFLNTLNHKLISLPGNLQSRLRIRLNRLLQLNPILPFINLQYIQCILRLGYKPLIFFRRRSQFIIELQLPLFDFTSITSTIYLDRIAVCVARPLSF